MPPGVWGRDTDTGGRRCNRARQRSRRFPRSGRPGPPPPSKAPRPLGAPGNQEPAGRFWVSPPLSGAALLPPGSVPPEHRVSVVRGAGTQAETRSYVYKLHVIYLYQDNRVAIVCVLCTLSYYINISLF